MSFGGGPAHLVGYSDGGSSALIAALGRPDLVRSLVTIGAHFHHDGILAAMVERFRHPAPDNPRLEPMRAAHTALSPDGEAAWAAVYRKVCAMALSGPTLSTEEVGRIPVKTLVVLADDDVVNHHHTVQLFESLPDARVAIVPSTSHLLPHEAPKLALIQRLPLPTATLSPGASTSAFERNLEFKRACCACRCQPGRTTTSSTNDD